jgi:N-acetylglucosamine malate deacetylase 1
MVKKVNKSILVFCAHPDDEIIGMGGTIAKYNRQGFDVHVVIFSYGEASHFWMKEHYTVDKRAKESKEASKVVGAKEIQFLGLKDGKLSDEIKKPIILKTIIDIIKEKKPVKIFTHSIDDKLYIDHVGVNNVVYNACKELKFKGDLFTFNIWGTDRKNRKKPKLVINISKTFKYKTKALKCFETQLIALIQLVPVVYFKSVWNGLKNKCLFAEVFRKIEIK